MANLWEHKNSQINKKEYSLLSIRNIMIYKLGARKKIRSQICDEKFLYEA